MGKKAILSIVLLFVFGFLGVLGYSVWRGVMLNQWAKNVPLTQAQSDAMWELWTAYEMGQPPKIDPLRKLTREDMDYLRKISLPHQYADESNFSVEKLKRLQEMGFTVNQRSLIMAMAVNHVGRRDIFEKQSKGI